MHRYFITYPTEMGGGNFRIWFDEYEYRCLYTYENFSHMYNTSQYLKNEALRNLMTYGVSDVYWQLKL